LVCRSAALRPQALRPQLTRDPLDGRRPPYSYVYRPIGDRRNVGDRVSRGGSGRCRWTRAYSRRGVGNAALLADPYQWVHARAATPTW